MHRVLTPESLITHQQEQLYQYLDSSCAPDRVDLATLDPSCIV